MRLKGKTLTLLGMTTRVQDTSRLLLVSSLAVLRVLRALKGYSTLREGIRVLRDIECLLE
jgi:hypothetical protein